MEKKVILQMVKNFIHFELSLCVTISFSLLCRIKAKENKIYYRVLLNPTFLLNIQQYYYCFPENSQIYKSIYICWQPFSPFMPSNNWLWQFCKCLPFKNKPNSGYLMEVIIKSPDTQWKYNVRRNISTK